MPIVSLSILSAGLATVAVADGFLPGLKRLTVKRHNLMAMGGSLTLMGVATIGFTLPLFRG